MGIDEIYRVIDGIAPKKISDEYCAKFGAYDNSGLLVNLGKETKSIVFSLDLTRGAIELAKEKGAKLIVTHHPVIYGKLSHLSVLEPTEEKIISCIENGISVISMHLNLDCVKGGIDDSLVTSFGGDTISVMEEVEGGSYGKISKILPTPIFLFKEKLSATLQSDRIETYGENDVSLVASFCGAGVSEEAIAFARRSGADTVLSSDWKHHLILLAREYGLNVVNITHYASESYGFQKFVKNCQTALSLPSYLWEDDLK